jgi:hypothetical protein
MPEILFKLNQVFLEMSLDSVAVLTAGCTCFVEHRTGDDGVWQVTSAKMIISAGFESSSVTVLLT